MKEIKMYPLQEGVLRNSDKIEMHSAAYIVSPPFNSEYDWWQSNIKEKKSITYEDLEKLWKESSTPLVDYLIKTGKVVIKEVRMKKAVFYLEEAKQDGIDGYIVKGWENVLRKEQLPKEYFQDCYFYEDKDNSINGYENVIIVQPPKAEFFFMIKKNRFIYKNGWEELHLLMYQAGHRLSEILRKPEIIRVEI